MSYETDPAGLGVSKRYGPYVLGGYGGVMDHDGAYREVIFEGSFNSLARVADQAVSIPAYSRIVEVLVEVEEVFGTGDTMSIELNGTMVTGAVVSVATAGILKPALSSTDADLTTGSAAEDLMVDVALIDAGTPATGKFKVVVRYATV